MAEEYGFNYKAYTYYKDESIKLRNALKRINDSITKTGPNSITMNMSIFELKGIIETALGDDNDK